MYKWIRNKLGNFGVWLCNRYYPRNCTEMEQVSSIQFACLMADEDVNRVVREKPVDYLGFSKWSASHDQRTDTH